jgi:LmbE family N-acetylglucosaminyl deacetylase
VFNVESALVLAPHADDGELGCGGTLARLIEAGVAIHYIAFSICEESVPEQFPRDILATEARRSCEALGILSECLSVHRYPVRHFSSHRQEILEDLVRVRHEIAPELIFVPAPDDVHQDHQVVFQEGLRAFKHSCLLGYELPWNNLTFTTSVLVELQERHLDEKLKALQEYESQWHRGYWNKDFVTSLARVRGVQAGTAYAEALQLIRWIVR